MCFWYSDISSYADVINTNVNFLLIIFFNNTGTERDSIDLHQPPRKYPGSAPETCCACIPYQT